MKRLTRLRALRAPRPLPTPGISMSYSNINSTLIDFVNEKDDGEIEGGAITILY